MTDPTPDVLASADRQALRTLDKIAEQLLAEKVPVHERTALLRAAAVDQQLMLRDGEILAIFSKAKRKLAGKASAATPDDEFDIPAEVWGWDQVIALQTPNLVVALQKVGKTALIAGLISAWHYGVGSFLGHELHGPCPPVIIAGTDQILADWRGVLAPAGLMQQQENGKWKLTPGGPIKRLWHRGQPVYLDMAGLEDIANACEQYPGALLLCDTYAALTAPLGLDEAKPEAAEPLYNLMELTDPFKVTPVLLHHASKSRANERASNASRNSNAIPAAVSQIISLQWLEADKKSDQRINLTTEGRNSKPIDLIIEQVERSQWISHGTADDIKESQRREQLIRKLNDRQSLAYDELCDRWDQQGKELTALGLFEVDPDLYGKERQARRTLDELVGKGLADERNGRNEAGTARAKYWRPRGADLTAPRARVGIQKECPNRPNRPHSPKASQRFEPRPICSEVSGKDSSDSKDSEFTSPHARQENLADWMSA